MRLGGQHHVLLVDCRKSVGERQGAGGMIVWYWSSNVEGSRSLADWICVMKVDVRMHLAVV